MIIVHDVITVVSDDIIDDVIGNNVIGEWPLLDTKPSDS